jgi:hypothetical protein
MQNIYSFKIYILLINFENLISDNSNNNGSTKVRKMVDNYFILLSFLSSLFYLISANTKISTSDNSNDGSGE